MITENDCFWFFAFISLQGCDGSVLISGSSAERSAPPNLGLRGFEVIDDAKTKVEAECPGVVSCADILAIAARDAVVLVTITFLICVCIPEIYYYPKSTDLTGDIQAKGPSWAVATGRRDGLISSSSEVTSNLPSPLESVSVQKQKFADKGLTTEDLVTLVGKCKVLASKSAC